MGRPPKKGQTSTTAIRLRPWTKGQLMRYARIGETADHILTRILMGQVQITPPSPPPQKPTILPTTEQPTHTV